MHYKSKDRNAAIRWAKRLLENANECVILDICTEEDDPEILSEVTEIAIYSLSGQELLNTSLVTSTATSGTKLADIWAQVLDLVRGKEIIVYNEEYIDLSLGHTLSEQGLEDDLPMQCAMEWYAQFVGKWNEEHQDYTWQKLPGKKDGTAACDCRLIIALINKMARGEEAVMPVKAVTKSDSSLSGGFFLGLFFVLVFLFLFSYFAH